VAKEEGTDGTTKRGNMPQQSKIALWGILKKNTEAR